MIIEIAPKETVYNEDQLKLKNLILKMLSHKIRKFAIDTRTTTTQEKLSVCRSAIRFIKEG